MIVTVRGARPATSPTIVAMPTNGLPPALVAMGSQSRKSPLLSMVTDKPRITCNAPIPLDLDHRGRKNGLFYHRQAEAAPDFYEERLLVYDRAGEPCRSCRTPIRQFVQAARSTYWCPQCQRG